MTEKVCLKSVGMDVIVPELTVVSREGNTQETLSGAEDTEDKSVQAGSYDTLFQMGCVQSYCHQLGGDKALAQAALCQTRGSVHYKDGLFAKSPRLNSSLSSLSFILRRNG